MTTAYSGITVSGPCDPESVPGTRDAKAGPPGFLASIITVVTGYSDLMVFAEVPGTDVTVTIRVPASPAPTDSLLAKFRLEQGEWAIVSHLYHRQAETLRVWASKPQTTWTLNVSAFGATGLTIYTPEGLHKPPPMAATMPAVAEPDDEADDVTQKVRRTASHRGR